jgi:hypothetical protein
MDLQELVRSIQISDRSGTGTTLFYVRVSDAERLLQQVKELEAEVTAWRKAFPLVGWDGIGIVGVSEPADHRRCAGG